MTCIAQARLAGFTADEIRELVAPPQGTPYGRRLLSDPADEAFEIIVMHWAPGDCLPHYHGDSQGFAIVIAGPVVHVGYEMTEDGLRPGPQDRFETGDPIPVDHGLIHHMGSPVPEGGGVTVHFYAPRITGMRVFPQLDAPPIVVPDNCGAWIPADLAPQRTP
jgi:cysteine dioxygenase